MTQPEVSIFHLPSTIPCRSCDLNRDQTFGCANHVQLHLLLCCKVCSMMWLQSCARGLQQCCWHANFHFISPNGYCLAMLGSDCILRSSTLSVTTLVCVWVQTLAPILGSCLTSEGCTAAGKDSTSSPFDSRLSPQTVVVVLHLLALHSALQAAHKAGKRVCVAGHQ